MKIKTNYTLDRKAFPLQQAKPYEVWLVRRELISEHETIEEAREAMARYEAADNRRKS